MMMQITPVATTVESWFLQYRILTDGYEQLENKVPNIIIDKIGAVLADTASFAIQIVKIGSERNTNIAAGGIINTLIICDESRKCFANSSSSPNAINSVNFGWKACINGVAARENPDATVHDNI